MSYFDNQKEDPWASSFGSSAPAYSFGEQPAAPQPSFAVPQPVFTAQQSAFAAPPPDLSAPEQGFEFPQTNQGKVQNLDFLVLYYDFFKQDYLVQCLNFNESFSKRTSRCITSFH